MRPVGIERFTQFFKDFWNVIRHKKQPKHITPYYYKETLALIFAYPNKQELARNWYRTVHNIVLAIITGNFLFIICALKEATDSVIDMGADLVWIVGIALIESKIWYLHFRVESVDEVIAEFEYFHRMYSRKSCNMEILEAQRNFFIAEFVMHLGMMLMLIIFSFVICIQPLWSDQSLPYHAILPFDWHNPERHPKTYLALYFGQIFMTMFNLKAILQIDMLGAHTFLQTALNLKILCIELRALNANNETDEQFWYKLRSAIKFHQNIIRTMEKTNRVFYGTFIIQMISSFLMISLSTFETLAAKDEPKLAAKFELFLLVTFLQLSLWCGMGDIVFNQSIEVARAAFEITDWHTKPIKYQHGIMFIIQRAQKPMVYAAKPFLPFTLPTYMFILKQCYTILALLRETID